MGEYFIITQDVLTYYEDTMIIDSFHILTMYAFNKTTYIKSS